ASGVQQPRHVGAAGAEVVGDLVLGPAHHVIALGGLGEAGPAEELIGGHRLTLPDAHSCRMLTIVSVVAGTGVRKPGIHEVAGGIRTSASGPCPNRRPIPPPGRSPR